MALKTVAAIYYASPHPVFPVCHFWESHLVKRYDHSSSESKVVLESDSGVGNLSQLGLASQLVTQLRALGNAFKNNREITARMFN